MKKCLILFYIIFISFSLFADLNDLKIKLLLADFKSLSYENILDNTYNFKDYLYKPDTVPDLAFDFIQLDYLDKLQKYEFRKPENPIRRAEILFFGSLTFTIFGGWIFFSIFNAMIYSDPFGKLRNEQFLPLYLGSCIISFSVTISDLFINLKPKISKNIEIY